ncbi:MAG: phage tail sheath C-terminal domain-containing protein [Rhodanobacter sp.]
MPARVSYPGVYIEELPSGVHAITGVATSIAAFFGRSSKGRLNHAERCLSLADFQRKFGAPHAQSDLAHAVRHFFANGGSDCHIVRLGTGATASAVTLRSLVTPAQPVLVATAKSEGAWANSVRLAVDYNTDSPHESFNLQVIEESAGVALATETFANLSMNPQSPRFAPDVVSQSSALIDLDLHAGLGDPTQAGSFINTIACSFPGYSQARRPITDAAGTAAATAQALNLLTAAKQNSFVIRVNDGAPCTIALGGLAAPANFAALEAALALDINNQLAGDTIAVSIEVTPIIGSLLTITATSGNLSSVRITCAANNDLAAGLMLGAAQGGLEQARFANFRPAPNATMIGVGSSTASVTPAQLKASLDLVAALRQDAFTSLTLDGVTVPLDAASNNLVTRVAADPWFQNRAGASAGTGDSDGVREKLQIIANAVNANAMVGYRAEVWGYQLALISKATDINAVPAPGTGVTTTPAAAGFTDAVTLNTRLYTLGSAGTSTFSTAGNDGSDGGAPTAADYIGDPVEQTGFHALDGVDLFNLLVLPPDSDVDATTQLSLWSPASVYCANHRAFLLIDAPTNWSGTDGRSAVVANTALVSQLNVSAKQNAAAFYPRVIVGNDGLKKTTGASGAIAGVIARTDATHGVWKAPAGIEADVRDVLGIDVHLTDLENGVLNSKAVNCLRVFPQGLVNWGARTLDGDDEFSSEWKYIPVRRLALNIEESLYRGTRWVVFEPNDEQLWANIRLSINAYMMSLFHQGAFRGASARDAFLVKCDKETTTQDDRNKGIVNIEVGFAPLKPAEFIIIKIQQVAGDR